MKSASTGDGEPASYRGILWSPRPARIIGRMMSAQLDAVFGTLQGRWAKTQDPELDVLAADISTHLYMRITAPRALTSVGKRAALKRIRIRTRLGEIHTDLIRIVAALSREAKNP